MPGMDGRELARRLGDQAVSAAKRPLLVAVSGCDWAEERAASRAAGIDLHLTEPVEPAVLVGLLARLREVLAPPPSGTGGPARPGGLPVGGPPA
jgi:CheY-like chemotaxis protein